MALQSVLGFEGRVYLLVFQKKMGFIFSLGEMLVNMRLTLLLDLFIFMMWGLVATSQFPFCICPKV